MSSIERKGPDRRRVFCLEGLEMRELLSMGTYSLHPVGGTPVSFSALAASAAQSNASADQSAAAPTPTPLWMRRQHFLAKFVGEYVVGAPRFTNQTASISLNGAGGSNQSLHANLQMIFFTPTSPTGVISGVAAMFPKNVATTGTVLAMDLTGAAQPTEHGLPTQFTWTVDSNSGGIYLAAGQNLPENNGSTGGFGTGSGTLTVQFLPTSKSAKVGNVIVSIQGFINGGGIFSSIQTPGNRANKP